MDVTDAAKFLKGVDIRSLAYADSHTRPRSKEELKDWAKTYFGWQLAAQQICPKHQAPLDILWELFNEDILDVVILASRTGGKTALIALLNLLDAIFKNGCEIGSMGAVFYQAQKGYSFFAQMIQSELFTEDVIATIMKETRLKNGSLVQILSGTMTGTNAPHPHKARADEVELIEWGILQQFFSMVHSERGIQGQQVLSSSRKSMWGSMQRLITKMETEPSFPFVLRTWCVKEVLEKCNEPCWKCREMVRSDGRSFWDVCKGAARNSDGFYLLRDVHRKFTTLDSDVFDAEWTCEKPAKKGLVYKDMPDERFGRYPFDPTRQSWCGADAGFVDPFSFHVYQNDGSDNVYAVRELYGPGVEDSTWAERVAELFGGLGLSMVSTTIYVDVRAKNLAAELKKAGFRSVKSRHHEIIGTVAHVKKWVRGVRHPKLFVDEEFCSNLKSEMGLYRYSENAGDETPIDEDNHCCDDLRYALCGRYPKYDTSSEPEIPVAAGDKGKVRGTDTSARGGGRWGGPTEPRPY